MFLGIVPGKEWHERYKKKLFQLRGGAGGEMVFAHLTSNVTPLTSFFDSLSVKTVSEKADIIGFPEETINKELKEWNLFQNHVFFARSGDFTRKPKGRIIFHFWSGNKKK